MTPEHDPLTRSETIARRLAWLAYRQVPRGMDRTTPAYRHWRRQAAGHAFLVAQLRALHPYHRRWLTGNPSAPALAPMTAAMLESMPPVTIVEGARADPREG